MEVLRINTKSGLMTTLEIFYICSESKLNDQVNDNCTVKSNIFDTVIQNHTERGQVSS
jgi:hypothetical protein